MRSKGGKIFYRCEECYSADIKKEVGHPVAFHEGKTENLYKCNTCNCMGYWKDRIKQNVLAYFNSIRPLVYLRKGNNVFIESKGITYKLYRVRVHKGMLYEINDKDMSREHPCDYAKGQITIDGKTITVKGRLG